MIEFVKTGGLAGIKEVIRIENDGSIYYNRFVSGTPAKFYKGQMSGHQVQTLVELTERVIHSSLPLNYRSINPVIDGFAYTLSYQKAKHKQSILFHSINKEYTDLFELVKCFEDIKKELYSKK